MIILEGADNSGKTTLANKFSGLPGYSAGPAPKDEASEIKCLIEQMNRADRPCVQDRLTCISQQIYADRLFDTRLGTFLMEMIKMSGVIIVYCRPPERVLMDFSTHNVKSYDTEDHIKHIIDNQHRFIDRYDSLMSTIPHMLYDWTDVDVNVDGMIQTLLTSQDGNEQWQKLQNQLLTRRPF
jgi:hypothetical protein